MRKQLLLLFAIIIFMFSNIIMAQSPGTATWPLTSTTTVNGTAVGDITVAPQELSNLEINNYAGINSSQRVRIIGNSWPVSQTTILEDTYIQFAVMPEDEFNFTVNSVQLDMAGAGGAFMRANVYISTEPTFATRTMIYESVTNLPTAEFVNVSATPNAVVSDGEAFYVRVYPWLYDRTSSLTGKYVLLQNLVVSVTTYPSSLGSNLVDVTLPSIKGTPGTEKLAPITISNVIGQNVTAFQFTLSYDKDVIEILGIETENTLTANNAPTYNVDSENGKLMVAWASASPLFGAGTLLNLQVKFKEPGITSLDFGTPSTFMFNSGVSPIAVIEDGAASTAAVLVQGHTVGATAGESIIIPILTTEITTAHNVVSYDFTASFDKDVINITGFDLDNTLSSNGSASINFDNTNGTVAFAWASGSNITGSGVLLNLVGTAVNAGTTELVFDSFQFNANSPVSAAEPALIMIAELNLPPTLTLNPEGPTFTVSENQTLQIQLIGSDPNTGEVLTYSATNLPQGASLNSETGEFSWKPGFSQEGSYTVTFRVTDLAGLSASKNVAIIVVKVNRPPVFENVLLPGQIVTVHNVPVAWDFTYTAQDPDGDDLIFSLVEGPAGSSITTSGVFTWIPRPDQAGKTFLVTVRVSDGTLSATTSELITGSTLVSVDDPFSGIPNEYVLLQNYPNPFNPTTTIQFGLPNESNVRLAIYNILGQELAVLLNKTMSAGFHRISFDATNLNTGMYIYKIEADNFSSIKKMLFIK